MENGRGVDVTNTDEQPTVEAARAMTPEVARVLVENHRRFLAFLERRVGRRELAEEVLQEAFVRGLARAESLRDAELATAWFYRVLRSALSDHHRRQGARARALEAAKYELSEAVDAEIMHEVCTCVTALVDTLKPEYAEAVRRVDLAGESVKDYADALGITANNAGVRLHRAREALHRQLSRSCGTCAEHGCIDCTCKQECRSK
jgi:RNA polymerase sigma-70 factor (ECF subfamily)